MSLLSDNTTPAQAHGRGRFDATVELNRVICREHYVLRLRLPGGFPPSLPGQFVQLGCRPPGAPDGAIDASWLGGCEHAWQPGDTPPQAQQPELRERVSVLRRPFSIAGRGDDAGGSWIDVIHRVVGVGTAWLAGLKRGDAVDLIGPLGNWFTLPAGKSMGLLVGGGVGLPPMFYLAQALYEAGWDAVGFVGALTADLLAVTFVADTPPDGQGAPWRCVEEYSQFDFPTVVTTDDGSLGMHGRITRGLERYLSAQTREDAAKTVVFTCGPNPMMHAVARLSASHSVDCQVCVEQAMACGMGTCQSCVVKIESPQDPHGTTDAGRPWRYRLACTDGPVFQAKEVLW